MLVLSVDPGLTGALSLIGAAGELLECLDLPVEDNGLMTGSTRRWTDAHALVKAVRELSQRHEFAKECVIGAIERPIPMPSLPAQTIGSQFDTFGVVRGIFAAVLGGGNLRYVQPREWKKLYGIGNDKERARSVVQALYPDAPVKRVKDHNRAEAILIGRFVWKVAA